jgi:hypothetical protein
MSQRDRRMRPLNEAVDCCGGDGGWRAPHMEPPASAQPEPPSTL